MLSLEHVLFTENALYQVPVDKDSICHEVIEKRSSIKCARDGGKVL